MALLLLASPPEAQQLATAMAAAGGASGVYTVETVSDRQQLDRALDTSNPALLVVHGSLLEQSLAWPRLLARQQLGTPSVVLIVDAASDLDTLDPATLGAVEDFIVRPVSADILYARIEQIRRRRALRSDAEIKRAFSTRIIGAQEAERHQISRELHDGIGQMMLVHRMDAEWLAQNAEPGPLREAAEGLATSLATTLETVRNLAMDLRPPAIDDLGIASALETLVTNVRKRTNIQCDWEIDLFERAVRPNVAVAAYRIAQEALDNAVRHSQGKHIFVHLRHIGRALELRVVDDGIGFDPMRDSGPSRLGLLGMRERTEVVGGTFTIESSANQGTCVKVVVPEILESSRE